MNFEDLRVDYFSPMPVVEKLKGSATFALDRFDVHAESGTVAGLEVSEGVAHLTALDTNNEQAHIEAVVKGALKDLLLGLNSKPLEAAKYLGIDPGRVGGETASRLMFKFPLVRTLDLPDVTIASAGRLVDVSLPGLVAGRDVTNGDLTVKVDKEKMEIAGQALFAGVPAEISGVDHFSDRASFLRRYELKATLTDEARKTFGLDTRHYLAGPVDVDLIWTDKDGTRGDLSVAANLKDATLDLSLIDWAKAKGTPGTAQASFSLEKERLMDMRDFTISSENLDIKGKAVFNKEGDAFREVVFDKLVSRRNDLSATLFFRKDGGYDIKLQGKSVDVARLFEESDEDEKLPPLSIALSLDALWVKPEGFFRQVSGTMQYEDDRWRSVLLNGMPAGMGQASLRILPDGPKRRLTLSAENAGAFLHSFDIYSNMKGGLLDINAVFDDTKPDRPLQGLLEIENSHVVKAPVLARMFTLASLTGILGRMSGDGIAFDKISGRFRLKNGILRVKEGGAFGSEIGLTADGLVNVREDTLDINGTIIPSYTLNSIWGKIPLLGRLLTSEKGGGLFAATYSAEGSSDDPDVSVNPLSALTPGVLRGVFGIFEHSTAEIDPEDEVFEGSNNTGVEPQAAPAAPFTPPQAAPLEPVTPAPLDAPAR